MPTELTEEQQAALALIAEAKVQACATIADRIGDVLAAMEDARALYPDGFTAELTRLENYLGIVKPALVPATPEPEPEV